MKGLTFSWAALAIGLLLLSPPTAAHAQQHRATRLGHPTTRFAPPIDSEAELRERFRDPKLKADFASILRQMNWPGDPEDMHRAAATAEVTEIQLPVGTIMPFMSSRENGRPIALREVLWAGDGPTGAYEFYFASRGRRYRCVTPKACSNFYVVDLGPEPPRIELHKSAPAEASLCDPIPMVVTVRNTGNVPVTQVRLQDVLPAGLRLRDGRTSLDMDAGALQPGEGRELKFSVFAAAAGTYVNESRAVCAEGVTASASATTVVRAPVLSLDCSAPAFVLLGRPIEVCLTVVNAGDVPEPKVTVTMPVPAGATLAGTSAGGIATGSLITWELPALDPGASQRVCATFAPFQSPETVTFTPSASGTCSTAVSVSCATEIRGVPGILLEVVDQTDPIQINEEVSYVITATNQGSTTATQLKLVCHLPPAQEFVSATGATRAEPDRGTIHFEPLPSLGPKELATWQVVIRAIQPADARFQTELTTDQFDRSIIEIESTHQY